MRLSSMYFNKQERKVVNMYVKNGIPIQVLRFLYDKELDVFEELTCRNGVEEFIETSTPFSHMCFVLRKGGAAYIQYTNDEVEREYIELIQAAKKHYADISLQR